MEANVRRSEWGLRREEEVGGQEGWDTEGRWERRRRGVREDEVRGSGQDESDRSKAWVPLGRVAEKEWNKSNSQTKATSDNIHNSAIYNKQYLLKLSDIC